MRGSFYVAFFVEPHLFVLTDFADHLIIEALDDMKVIEYRLNQDSGADCEGTAIHSGFHQYCGDGCRYPDVSLCASSARRYKPVLLQEDPETLFGSK